MRRLVGAVMMGLVVLGATACGSDDGKADAAAPSSAAAPSATADGTDAACKEAVEMGEAATKFFTTKAEELQALAVSGGEDLSDEELAAKADESEKAIRAEFTKWTEKLTALAATDVEAPVKAALTDGAATMTKLNGPDDQTALDQVPTTLTGITTKIKTACA